MSERCETCGEQVLVPETTIKTEWIYEDTFVCIPRQVPAAARIHPLA